METSRDLIGDLAQLLAGTLSRIKKRRGERYRCGLTGRTGVLTARPISRRMFEGRCWDVVIPLCGGGFGLKLINEARVLMWSGRGEDGDYVAFRDFVSAFRLSRPVIGYWPREGPGGRGGSNITHCKASWDTGRARVRGERGGSNITHCKASWDTAHARVREGRRCCNITCAKHHGILPSLLIVLSQR